MSLVKNVENDEQFPQLVQAAGSKLVVVDFSASWCGPCRTIAPVVAEMANKFSDTAVFLKVDIDTCKTTAASFQVSSVPTFLFLKKGKKVDMFSGADSTRLHDCIVKHQGDSESIIPGHSDLIDSINTRNVECLNQSEHHTVSGLLAPNELYLESDADEQLIISVPFQCAVKIHSINICAPKDGRGPKKIKIFSNPTAVPDFDECESLKATQEIELTERDLAASTLTNLLFVQFQNVNNIVIFVENNQGDEETTVIDYLQIIGSPVGATNMKEFKRVAGEAGERHG